MDEIVIDFDPEVNELLIRLNNLTAAYYEVHDGEHFGEAYVPQEMRLACLDNVSKEIDHVMKVLKSLYNYQVTGEMDEV